MILQRWIAASGEDLLLDGSVGITVLRGTEGLDAPPIANELNERVGADGSVLLQTRRPTRSFSLQLLVDLTKISAGTVARLFESGRIIASTGRELRDVRLAGGFEGLWSVNTGGIDGLTHRKFVADFIALDPWWYGPGTSQTVTIGSPTAWNAAIPWNSAIPWNGGSSVGLTVLGDAPAWPVWTLHGQITTLTVSLVGSGAWTWISTLDSVSYGTVDHRPGSRSPRLGSLLNGVAESSFGLWFLVDDVGSLDWGLPTGAPAVVVGATGTGGSTAVTVTYEPRYLTAG